MFAEESSDWRFDFGGSVVCEMCGEEPATIHLLRVADGGVTHTHLCGRCAEGVADESEGLAIVLAVPSALRQLGRVASEDEAPTAPQDEGEEPFCPLCGTTRSDLKETGLVGCVRCYQVFEEYLEGVLRQSTEPVEHMGKMPRRGPETDTLRHEIMRLQRMLHELVACERFEEAAGVRDRLVELGERLDRESV